MNTIGNILWHIPFLGFLTAISTLFLGALLTITIIAAPVGLGLIEYGKFLLWPFGNGMVDRKYLPGKVNPIWKAYSTLIWLLYLPFGIVLAFLNLLQGITLFLTIIGIPVALVIFKSLGTFLNPVNKKCVPVGVQMEVMRRR